VLCNSKNITTNTLRARKPKELSMGVSTSRPSYISEVVRKRKTSSLPAFETDLSAASNNKKARRRRSNEEDSPLPIDSPLFNEHVEDFEDAHFEDSQRFLEKVIAYHLVKGSSLLRDSNKEPPISPLTPVTPLLNLLLPPDSITRTFITTTTVTTTAVTTPDGKTTLNTSSTSNTTNLIPVLEVAVIRPCEVPSGVDQAFSIRTPYQEIAAGPSSPTTQAEVPAQTQACPFTLRQPTNDTQAIDDLPVSAMAKADSTAPESVEQATDFLTAIKDATPSFEDRVIQLREYYDVHGDIRVPQGYKGGCGKDLGVWVKRIREVYKKNLKKTSALGKESPGIVLGPCKLSKLRIERLEAMAFEWSAMQRNGDSSFEGSIAELRQSENGTPSFEHRIVELQEYYEQHGHLRVPQGYTGCCRTKKLGLWIKRIREVYQCCLKKTSDLGEESPGIVLGNHKLSKLRIEQLEAMGFKWSVVQRTVPVNVSKKAAAAPLASSLSTETQDSPDLCAPARTTADASDPWREQVTASLAPKPASGIPTATDATSSFEDRFIQLQEYYDVYGHLRVPQGYKGGRGKDLGVWVKRIREVYQRCRKQNSDLGKESPGIVLGPRKLSKHRIERLDAMAFEWSAMQWHGDSSFEDRIAELQAYHDEHGHLRVSQGCTGGRSKDLGVWVKRVRDGYQKFLKNPTLLAKESPGIVLGSYRLSKLRIERLEAMGFKWSVEARRATSTASKKEGAAPFASSPSTETQDSPDLSAPARTIADSSDPGPEHAAKLDAPGKSTSVEDCTPSFEDRIIELQEYYDEHGHLRVPQGYKGRLGKDLGVWVKRIRETYYRCLKKPTYLGVESPGVVFVQRKLTQSRIERLEAMGFAWSLPKESWEKHFQELVAFKVSFFSALYRNNIIISSRTLTRIFC
jgi:hypothetical protein